MKSLSARQAAAVSPAAIASSASRSFAARLVLVPAAADRVEIAQVDAGKSAAGAPYLPSVTLLSPADYAVLNAPVADLRE